ncbi:hypothetical protein M422DRAFT_101992, partial [Sphaerobolus stellatus SS14]
PIELLNKLIGDIDKPSDLLSLALTSQSFEKLLSDHLDYRIIQCSPADRRVWQHLSKHPRLAKRVKSI